MVKKEFQTWLKTALNGVFQGKELGVYQSQFYIAKIAEKQAEKKDTEAMMTTFSVYNLARNNSFDYSKAKNELGYTTRPYEETIRDMVKWLKKEGKIK